jgi:uncharacterized membrane protein
MTVLGVLLFALPHLLASFFPGQRDRIKARYGEGRYKGVFSLVTGVGFILMVLAYWWTKDSGDLLFAPNGAARHVTMLFATLGMISLAAAHGKSHIRLWVQNPMSVGLALWSFGHLLAVGKWAADWLWLSILAVALADIVVSMIRGDSPDYQPTWRSDIIAVVAGLVLTAVLLFWFHPYVLGVYPLH